MAEDLDVGVAAVGERESESASGDVVVPGVRRYVAMDGWRALAALSVLIFHTAGEGFYLNHDGLLPSVLSNFGNFGVAIFFVLSGFVIYQPFVDSILGRTPLPASRPFWIKRFFRIFPAYWLALAVHTLFISKESIGLGQLVRRVLLVDVYSDGGVFSGFFIAWTLTVELGFYLLLPGFARLMAHLTPSGAGRRRVAWIHVSALSAVYFSAIGFRLLTRSHTFGLTDGSYLSTPCFVDWFALGMLLAFAAAWTRHGGVMPDAVRQFGLRPWLCWICAATSFAALLYVQRNKAGVMAIESYTDVNARHFFNGLTAFLLVLPVTVARKAPSLGIRVLASRSLVFLGSISFGIYLWHTLVLKVVWDWASTSTPAAAFWGHLPLVAIGTVACAVLSYRVVERPAIEYARALLERRSGVSRSGRE